MGAGTIRLGPIRQRRVNESLSTWRWGDRVAYVLC